ncbi:hypothetical protein SCT_1286 [Sulfuricella sp. T08]|uniref:hypothetical protein n=1 Tax=Sulfuricella sp. T08 TaxID=1632857 RepID=UPI0006179674|nr:hypothetical protein [Sulfuricella sp. T08]GAO35890.1 hypothetical protein SCT_1286 [Sulfuricella sp. T08]
MSLFRRQLLYLTNDQITAYQWVRGSHSVGRSFPNDETGWDAFSRHLAGSQDTPTYLLADLIEEDFQLDSLPHVLGRSRRALVQRRLGQLYRDTPYRQAIQQGREEHGRKDDRMLFSALTNVGLLKPWLGAILEQKVPLTGIYSPALLSATLIKKLGLASDNLLLVTHQSSGLRQSFFQGSALKFSRLTPLADHHPDTVADTTARETANTQQFLASARLLQRGVILDTVILAHGESLARLQAACSDTPAMAHRFLDLTDVATQLGLKNPGSVSRSDPLFLSLLGHAVPSSHYAQAEQTRCYSLWQARLVLYILSAGTVMGALLSAGANSLDSLNHYQQSQQMAMETNVAQSQYRAAIRSLPPTTASPQNMKAAVNIEQMIFRNAPSPAQLLGIVSRALDTLPQIRIDQLNWAVSAKAETAVNSADSQQPPPAPSAQGPAPDAAVIGIPKKPNQVLLLEGEVTPFGNDYRTALESVRLLAAELGKNKQLQVEITRQPLDIKPSVILSGNTGAEESGTKARFILKLTLRPES